MKIKAHFKYLPIWIKFLLFFVKPRYSYDLARKGTKDKSVRVKAKFLFGIMYVTEIKFFETKFSKENK